MKEKLVLQTAGGDMEFPLGDEPVVIGRDASCTITINDNMASRRHAQVVRKEGCATLTDMGSSNGTFLNGNRVTSSPLVDGDVIVIGESAITYVRRQAAPAEKPAKVEMEESVADLQRSVFFKSPAVDRRGTPEARHEKMFSILFNVGKAVSGAETLDGMVSAAMEMIFSSIDAQRGMAMFLEGTPPRLVPMGVHYRDKTMTEAGDIHVSSTIVNRVIADRVAVITSDAQHDPRFSAGESIQQLHIRSALCVPLWDEGQIFGIVYLDNLATSHRFTNDDMTLLAAIGNLIAIRLRQERLHDKLQKETVRRLNLAKYHSPDVVDLLMSQHEAGEIALQEREVTVLFVDIASSVVLAERLPPAVFAALLNDFFEIATAAIFKNGGHVNKFIGDCVMAIFNAPLDVTEHGWKAVDSALRIVEEIEAKNKNGGAASHGYDVHVGINTGRALVGNVGTKNRKEYTVVGDVVNTSARLTKGDRLNEVIISESTLKAASSAVERGELRTESLGGMQMKGKERPVMVYKVLRNS